MWAQGPLTHPSKSWPLALIGFASQNLKDDKRNSQRPLPWALLALAKVIHHAELLGRDLCHHCIADSVFYQYCNTRISISLQNIYLGLRNASESTVHSALQEAWQQWIVRRSPAASAGRNKQVLVWYTNQFAASLRIQPLHLNNFYYLKLHSQGALPC